MCGITSTALGVFILMTFNSLKRRAAGERAKLGQFWLPAHSSSAHFLPMVTFRRPFRHTHAGCGRTGCRLPYCACLHQGLSNPRIWLWDVPRRVRNVSGRKCWSLGFLGQSTQYVFGDISGPGVGLWRGVPAWYWIIGLALRAGIDPASSDFDGSDRCGLSERAARCTTPSLTLACRSRP